MKRATEWVGLACVTLFYLQLNSGTWLISPDAATYMDGARSLASLRGFLDASGAPITIVPPGTSALYAVAAYVKSGPSTDFTYFNLITKFLVIGFVGLSFLVVQREAGTGVALVAAAFIACSQTLIVESTRILSDIPFATMFMLTVWLFPLERLEGVSPRSALLLGCLIAWGYLLRTVGIFVLLGYSACILFSVRRNKIRTLAIMFGVFVAVALPLWIRAQHYGSAYSYVRLMFLKEPWVLDSGPPSLRDWYERIVANIATGLKTAYVIASNRRDIRVNGIVISALMTVGVVSALAHRRFVLPLWLLIFCSLALIMTLIEFRYFIPILPLLALLVWEGARSIIRWFRSDRFQLGAVMALLAVICLNPYWRDGLLSAQTVRAQLDLARGTLVSYPGHEAFVDLIQKNNSHLSSSDVVATMHADVLRYFVPADVRVRGLPILDDVDRSYQAIKHAGTTYLYCDKMVSSIWPHIEPVISTYASSFTLIAENRSAAIYRVVP